MRYLVAILAILCVTLCIATCHTTKSPVVRKDSITKPNIVVTGLDTTHRYTFTVTTSPRMAFKPQKNTMLDTIKKGYTLAVRGSEIDLVKSHPKRLHGTTAIKHYRKKRHRRHYHHRKTTPPLGITVRHLYFEATPAQIKELVGEGNEMVDTAGSFHKLPVTIGVIMEAPLHPEAVAVVVVRRGLTHAHPLTYRKVNVALQAIPVTRTSVAGDFAPL